MPDNSSGESLPTSKNGLSIPLAGLEGILREFQGRKGVLLEVFHRIQHMYGYVPLATIEPVGRALHMSAPAVYGTLTFYTEFRTSPPPKVRIGMCLGPTCHIKGAEVTKDILEHHLGIAKDGTTPDNTYGVHVVQCAGHCHLAPLLYLNDEVRGNVEIGDAVRVVEDARRLASAEAT